MVVLSSANTSHFN